MSAKIKRSVYAGTFGPTIGDRVRLADTDLIVDVEKDFAVYGEGVNSAEAGDRRRATRAVRGQACYGFRGEVMGKL